MPDVMQILSRDAFAEALQAAQQRTAALDPGRWPLLRQVAAQLDFMARETAAGRVPHEDERTRTTLGPLAARNLEDVDPEYADQLEELDYTFRRYPQLPEGAPVRRRGILQCWSGADAYHKLILELGKPRTVGSAGADLVVNADPAGAPHFKITWDGVSAHVQAIEPHRLTIGGKAAWYGEMANRGWMTAGRTTFRFFVEDRTPPDAPATPTDAIDAARSDRALQLIEESIDPYASLYDGEQGRAFDDVAPYLVHLQPSSWLLERLVTEGWGDAWGIYVESQAGFDKVRRHLRQFLMVEAEGEPHRLFFRFYDPRVMRTFAEAITPEQRAAFLKDAERITFETPDGLKSMNKT